MIWLDGNDIFGDGTKPSNGASVSSWVDKSGKKNNFSQSTGGIQPTYTLNSRGILGAVNFNGSSQYMRCLNSSDNIFSNNGDITVFSVCLTTNASTNHIIAKGSFPSGGWAAYCNPSGYFSFVATNVVQLEDSSTTFTPNSYQIYNATFNSSAGSAAFSKNGGAVSTVTGATGSVGNSQTITLGTDNALARFWSGPLGEVIVYSRALTATEVTLINRYLQNKWGLR